MKVDKKESEIGERNSSSVRSDIHTLGHLHTKIQNLIKEGDFSGTERI